MQVEGLECGKWCGRKWGRIGAPDAQVTSTYGPCKGKKGRLIALKNYLCIMCQEQVKGHKELVVQ